MSDDLISRQAAIKLLKAKIAEIFFKETAEKNVEKWLNELPPVQSELKIGRWIYKERDVLINTGCVSYGENGAVQEKRWTKVKKPYCSECGWYEDSEYEATPYCPNCGAKMESDNNDS